MSKKLTAIEYCNFLMSCYKVLTVEFLNSHRGEAHTFEEWEVILDAEMDKIVKENE